MTASIALVGSVGAMLAADAAVWHPDGTLSRFGGKIIRVPGASSVVMGHGVFSSNLLRLMIVGAPSLDVLWSRLQEFAMANPARVQRDDGWPDEMGEITFRGASWSEGRGIWWELSKSEHGDYGVVGADGGLRYSPDIAGDLTEVVGRPMTTRQHAATLTPPEIFAIMDAQRRRLDDAPGMGPIHCAGGWCDLATVTAEGIKVERIGEWPQDRVGERIAA